MVPLIGRFLCAKCLRLSGHTHFQSIFWLIKFQITASGCICCSTLDFRNGLHMQYVADCTAQWHIFNIYGWKIKSWAVRWYVAWPCETLPHFRKSLRSQHKRHWEKLQPSHRWHIHSSEMNKQQLYELNRPFRVESGTISLVHLWRYSYSKTGWLHHYHNLLKSGPNSSRRRHF